MGEVRRLEGLRPEGIVNNGPPPAIIPAVERPLPGDTDIAPARSWENDVVLWLSGVKTSGKLSTNKDDTKESGPGLRLRPSPPPK